MSTNESWSNWSGGQTCRPAAIEHPESVEAVRSTLAHAAASGWKVRVAGAGHSFTSLVPTEGLLLRLDRMNRVLSVDQSSGRVEVEAGIGLQALNRTLADHGLAMPNLGDIDVQTLAGALATGTHGTGAKLPNLSAQVEAMELVTAEGEILRLDSSGDPDLLRAARVSLGALGVVTAVTLRCVKAFTLHGVNRPMGREEVLGQLEALAEQHDHFEFFAFPYASRVITRANDRTDLPPKPRSSLRTWGEDVLLQNRLFDLVCRLGRARPSLIPMLDRISTAAAGSSERVDRSDRIFATPRHVRFEEMEYCVPRAEVAQVVRQVLGWVERERHPVNFPIEVRFSAPDDAFLSPAFERESGWVAIHAYRGMAFEPYFRAVEAIMDAHDGRPHWGKRHFQTASTLAPRYPAWERFAQIRARLDPNGRFATEAMAQLLGVDSQAVELRA